jgi:class 3 adenylate cyclase
MLNVIGNLTCAHCGIALPLIARFCMNCGGAQTAQNTRMRAAHLVGERKLITVLFADVVGSTSLAECMDPGDWAAVMNRAFARLSPVIAAYGGTIARLMGDGMLAFFGAPAVHADDPLRAVGAARELLGTALAFSNEVQPVLGSPFELRVGINTGWVVLGDVGTELKFEYTAMGDAVNVAARLQAAAQPMTALLTQDTYYHVSGRVACRDRGIIPIRGRKQPVRAFEVQPAAVHDVGSRRLRLRRPAPIGQSAHDRLARDLREQTSPMWVADHRGT